MSSCPPRHGGKGFFRTRTQDTIFFATFATHMILHHASAHRTAWDNTKTAIMKRHLICCLAGLSVLATSCKDDLTVTSPDGDISVGIEISDNGRPQYSISVKDIPLVGNSSMGLVADGCPYSLSDDFRTIAVRRSSADMTWEQPWGENKSVRDRHNEMSVLMKNPDGVSLTVRIRAFDDGVGFRYEYEVPVTENVVITDELTEFNFARDATSWSIPANFDTYELLYRTMPLSQVETANTPMTFRTDSGTYASVHEAALTDFPEMTLSQTEGHSFKAFLAPLPDGTKAVVPASFKTPWRTIQIADKAVGLINSSLILNLNEPCALEDTDWIRPMKYIGVWWGMHLGVESWVINDRHGATTENALRYIDFAAANDIDAVLFEGWNEGWESWGGRQNFDFTKPYADFDIKKIMKYAESKGISVINHHETGGNVPNYERQLDAAYAWSRDLGMPAVKTGYAGGFPDGHSHHGQYGVKHYRNVVLTAARHKAMLDVHEPIKATGIRRTYPNMMTREGARGMEWNAWSEGNPPEHQSLLAFTRLLGGPMDYTPGIFDILYENIRDNPDRKQWNMKDSKDCRVNTTLAKQIACWVVLYSPLQMASDMIENYEGHPAFQFFRDFDPDCDWSEALAGEPGDFVSIVRRAGDNYFLGSVTDENAREYTLPLSFLEDGRSYTATFYADGENADWKTNPTSYRIYGKSVTSKDSIDVKMAAGGGQAVVFKPL